MKGEYYKTKESVEDYILLAKDVNGKQLIDKLEKVLPANSVLLEIGSGPGTDWKILNKSYQVTGSDNSKEFLNHLSTAYPDEEFLEYLEDNYFITEHIPLLGAEVWLFTKLEIIDISYCPDLI